MVLCRHNPLPFLIGMKERSKIMTFEVMYRLFRSQNLKILRITRRSYSFINNSKNKIMISKKCYFSYIRDEDKVDITFLLPVKESMRQFNFSRKPTESLKTLYGRIGTNVQKAICKAIKKKAPNSEEVQVHIADSFNHFVSEDVKCVDLFSMDGSLKLKVREHLFEIVFNAPWVVTVSLPQIILAGFPIYPENLITRFSKREQCLFNWFTGISKNDRGSEISENHIKWQPAGTSYRFVPKTQDIGMKIKLECIPGNSENFGPAVEVISKNVVEAGPGLCPFEIRQRFTNIKLTHKSFRCVTYNILADLYCDSDYTRAVLHPYCPPYALHIDYRKQLIIKELIGYNADIICLQEVDKKIFNGHLVPLLDTEMFSGVFHKKGKEVPEGLACFYRNNRFSLLEEQSIVLAEAIVTKDFLKPIYEKVKTNKKLLERLLNRSTVASYTVLQSKDNPNEIVLVGNTHLYFHPDADHIKLIQGGIVIYWLNHVKEMVTNKFPDKRVSLVLCGDFNSVPSCGVYQLYTSGIVGTDVPDWSSNQEEAVIGLSLQQNVLLESACGTPQFTNYTVGFADCLDYIYYEKSNFVIEQVVPLPSIEELTAHTALPSIVFPSDHIALVSDFRFLDS